MQVDSFLDRLQVANSTRAKGKVDKEDQDEEMKDQDDDDDEASEPEEEETVVDSGQLPVLRLHTDP